MNLRTATRAEHDLVAIWNHIASGSVDQADRVVDHIRSEFDRLARMPRLGRRREDLGHPALRSWVVLEYLVFYVVLERDVLIARVVHGHQDLSQVRYEDNDWPDSVCEARLPWGLAAAG